MEISKALVFDALYNEFKRYPLKKKIDGCPHCELAAAESKLHSRGLRQLTWEEFSAYPFKALTTFGDVADFKHFLPRILELLVNDYVGGGYPFDMFLSKLAYAKFEQWPASEKRAVELCFEWWAKSLEIAQSSSEDDAYIHDEVVEGLQEHGFKVTY